MFHFKRQTLWIIIYVTIPLIFILNSIDSSPENDGRTDQIESTSWSLDAVQLDCTGLFCHQLIENTHSVLITAILKPLPVSQIGIPEELALVVSQQGDYVVATFSFKVTKQTILDFREFVTQWIPKDADVKWLVSGAEPKVFEDLLIKLGASFTGQSLFNEAAIPNAAVVLKSPPFGDPEQLAFLLWVEVLKQRLADKTIDVTWDHRQSSSYVLFNQALASELFVPVETTELASIVSAYLASANKRMRTALQLHRYGVTSLVYDVPYELFINQPQRLAQITLDSVNKMRDFSFEQTK